MQKEDFVRLAFFIGSLLIVALWELIAPRRQLTASKPLRWFTNLSLVVLNTLAVRFLLPVLPVGLALMMQERGWGFLNILVLPTWFTIFLSVLVLDLVISISIKLAAVALLGPPVVAVVIFEVVLNASAQFNHGNIRIPEPFDRFLRLFVVTPDMHRVHHSVIPRETNSNFGFNVPWWDRLLGTYRAQPEQGHLGMTIGLKEYRDPAKLTLVRLLLLPFIKE